MKIESIDIADFDYGLPDNRIAQVPLAERDQSKLLIYNNGNTRQDVFSNIEKYIPDNSLLVFNNTRVIRARLLFKKESGANIEILCLEPLQPSDYALSFSSVRAVEWKCIVGNLKKWKTGDLRMNFRLNGTESTLTAKRTGSAGDAQKVVFQWDNEDLSFGQVIMAAGHLPLPPYIQRDDTEEDNIRYQTIYSREDGSVAAPTAGLHFSESVFRKLDEKGVKNTQLTLHVGAGTFKPVKQNDISKHEMHCEHFEVSRETLKMLLLNTGNIIAVGTTSVRTIESLYWLGTRIAKDQVDLTVSQWEPYENETECTVNEAFEALITYMDREKTDRLQASTSIMIIPGYKFRVTNAIITNFHQPRSTLLLLISAWTGDDWKKIYNYALKNNFRFLSYGDSSILFRNT